jgi:hypothetical protein
MERRHGAAVQRNLLNNGIEKPTKLKKVYSRGLTVLSSGSIALGTMWPALRHNEDSKVSLVVVAELLLLAGLTFAGFSRVIRESGTKSN